MSDLFLYPNKPVRFYDLSIIDTLNPKDFLLQPKWNGMRVIVTCTKEGIIEVFTRQGRLRFKGEWQWLSVLPLPKPWSLDGEFLEKKSKIIVWDYAILNGENKVHSAYVERLSLLEKLIPHTYSENNKIFTLIKSYDINTYLSFLSIPSEYLEGLVIKYKYAKNLWGMASTTNNSSQLKYIF